MRTEIFWVITQRVVAIPYRRFEIKYWVQFSRVKKYKKLFKCSQIVFNIFISTSLHVSGNYAPIIRRTYCIYATLVFFTLYEWLSGRDVSHPDQPTRQPPIQSAKYQCRIDTVSSPDDGYTVVRNM